MGKDLPREEIKPWGREILYVVHKDRYAAKLLIIEKGHRLSRQYHEKKTETLLVISGKIILEVGAPPDMRQIPMKPWNYVHILPNRVHRIHAVTSAVIVEVSTTELDDTRRLADDYGRMSLSDLLDPKHETPITKTNDLY